MYLQVPQGWGGIGQVGMSVAPVLHYSQGSSQVPPDTDSRVPVINLNDGTRLAGDDAPRRKDLEQWLKEHPGFVADTGAFIPVSPSFCFLFYRPNCLLPRADRVKAFCGVTGKLAVKLKSIKDLFIVKRRHRTWLPNKFTHGAQFDNAIGAKTSLCRKSTAVQHFHMKLFPFCAQGVNKMQMQFHFQDGRPKQKRHRCRNPNKIDVNSLTGEERVQIINRRNARKVCLCVALHGGLSIS